jgi:hypothetical protein
MLVALLLAGRYGYYMPFYCQMKNLNNQTTDWKPTLHKKGWQKTYFVPASRVSNKPLC